MIDFKKCLERGEVIMSSYGRGKLTEDRLVHKLAMGSKMKRFNGKGLWEYRFGAFDTEAEEIGNMIGTCSLLPLVAQGTRSLSILIPKKREDYESLFRF